MEGATCNSPRTDKKREQLEIDSINIMMISSDSEPHENIQSLNSEVKETFLLMESIPCQASLYFPFALQKSPSVNGKRRDHAMTRNFQDRFCPLKVKLPRRDFLQFIGYNSVLLLHVNSSVFAAPIMPEMKDPEVIRTLKLASGVRIQDVIEGEGPEAHEGDLVEVNYVCRRSNGYFVHSTVDQFSGESAPVVLPLDENQIIKGLKEVLVGMKVGGKRRALIPPSVGYTSENLKPVPEEFGPRRSLLSHANEPLVFEVQLLKVL